MAGAKQAKFAKKSIINMPYVNLKPLSAGCICLAVLCAVYYFLKDLETHSRVPWKLGLGLFALGSVFFTSLYVFFVYCAKYTPWGRQLTKQYNFSQSDLLDLSTKCVSSVQALMCCAVGCWIIGHSCPADLMKSNHYISDAYTWFGSAYFFYDIWSMHRVHTLAQPQSNGQNSILRFFKYVRSNPLIVGHHLFIGCFGFSVVVLLRGNLGDCVFGYVFLMEASTPLVSLRSILARLHVPKTHKVYIANGFLMVFVFFLCRIVMFPYVVHLYAQHANLGYFQAVQSLPRGCKISISILLFPQLYWFYLMVKGAAKIVGRIEAEPKRKIK